MLPSYAQHRENVRAAERWCGILATLQQSQLQQDKAACTHTLSSMPSLDMGESIRPARDSDCHGRRKLR